MKKVVFSLIGLLVITLYSCTGGREKELRAQNKILQDSCTWYRNQLLTQSIHLDAEAKLKEIAVFRQFTNLFALQNELKINSQFAIQASGDAYASITAAMKGDLYTAQNYLSSSSKKFELYNEGFETCMSSLQNIQDSLNIVSR